MDKHNTEETWRNKYEQLRKARHKELEKATKKIKELEIRVEELYKDLDKAEGKIVGENHSPQKNVSQRRTAVRANRELNKNEDKNSPREGVKSGIQPFKRNQHPEDKPEGNLPSGDAQTAEKDGN